MTLQINIIDLDTGTVKGSDFYPAVDTTDTSQASDGTTKKYEISDLLDFVLNSIGILSYPSCVTASTVNLTSAYNNGTAGVGATLTNSGLQAAFSLDGVAGVVGSRYLIKNQTSGAQNGIYTLTTLGSGTVNWVLTRATDFNSSSNIINNKTVFVTNGSTQANTLWVCTFSGSMTVGTTVINWSLFSLNPNVTFTWNVISGTSQAISENNGYIPTNVALTTFTLPASSDVGDSFKIYGYGSGGWQIAQNVGQSIHLGSAVTSTGVLGFLASTNRYDLLEITCLVANTEFTVDAVVGNITVN